MIGSFELLSHREMNTHARVQICAQLSQMGDLRGVLATTDIPLLQLACAEAARRDRLDAEPSPSPTATSPASPLPPTFPDGAGASCACSACRGGPVIACRACERGMAEYVAHGGLACRACSSPRLRQSDTSDHPGVIRCDACGLVQAS